MRGEYTLDGALGHIKAPCTYTFTPCSLAIQTTAMFLGGKMKPEIPEESNVAMRSKGKLHLVTRDQD